MHADRTAHYFLVSVEPGPMAVGGPEALVASDRNRYAPAWVSRDHLASENLEPEVLRALLSGLPD